MWRLISIILLYCSTSTHAFRTGKYCGEHILTYIHVHKNKVPESIKSFRARARGVYLYTRQYDVNVKCIISSRQ